MLNDIYKYLMTMVALFNMTGCSRAEVPILDFAHDKPSVPYVCWINQEPVAYIVPPYRASWYGFPLRGNGNVVRFDYDGPKDGDFFPPELRLRYLGTQSVVDIMARRDGAEFDATRSERSSKFGLVPSDFDADRLRAYTTRTLELLESGDRAGVNLLLESNDGAKLFPSWIFERSSTTPARGQGKRNITVLVGKYLILACVRSKLDVPAAGGSPYLLQIKSGKSEFTLESLSYYFNKNQEICIYTVDSAVLGKAPPPVLRLAGPKSSNP